MAVPSNPLGSSKREARALQADTIQSIRQSTPQRQDTKQSRTPTNDIQQIKARLDLTSLVERHVGELRREGSYLKALCPFHREKTPSLAIYPSRQRWQCFGCDRKGDVIDFLGHVRFHGLWDRANSSQFKEVLAEAVELADLASAASESSQSFSRFPGPLTIGNSGKSPQLPEDVQQVYELREHDGTLIAYHLRKEDSQGKKTGMPYMRPDGSWGLGDLPKEDLPLYRSHLLTSSREATIVLTEGEKGADALSAHLSPDYLVLGTACGSSTTPSHKALQPLVGRNILLVPDADEQGLAHMQRIALRLLELGVPHNSLSILLGYDLADLTIPLEEVFARKAKPVTPQLAAKWQEEVFPDFPAPKESGNRENEGFIPVWLQPEPPPREWLVEDLVPQDTITLLYGDAGLGKSAFAAALALHVCTGNSFLGKSTMSVPVAYIDTEFDSNEFIRRCYAIARGMGLSGPPRGIYYLRTQGALTDPKVRAQIESVWEVDFVPGLLVLDSLTLGAFQSDTKDVGAVVGIINWLEQLNITALVIDHQGKPTPGANLSDYRAYGSFAKTGKARHILQLIAADGGGVVVRVSKSNLTARGLTLGFSLNWEGKNIYLREERLGSDALAGAEHNLPRSTQVLIALARYPNGASVDEVASELDMSPKTVQNHLSALHSQGKVQQLERGKWIAR